MDRKRFNMFLFQVEKAWYLYTECQENNIPLSVEAYNAVMSMTSQLKEADDQSKTLIKNIYTAMARNGIIPNIHTFNAVLNTASILKNKRAALDLTCNVFADIAKFNLKPTLTTYYYVLRVLQKFGNLYSILSLLFCKDFAYRSHELICCDR